MTISKYTDTMLAERFGDELYSRFAAQRARWNLKVDEERSIQDMLSTWRNFALSESEGGLQTGGARDYLVSLLHRLESIVDSPEVAKLREAQRRKDALVRCRTGGASDEDRVLLAERKGNTMYGPLELQRCIRHRRNFETYRWVWEVPKDGDHLTAVTSSEPEFVRGCPKCDADPLYD